MHRAIEADANHGDAQQHVQRVTQNLLAKSLTKTSLANTLQTLSDAGVLRDADGENLDVATMKRSLTQVARIHANTQTPCYGPLVQHIDLGIPDMPVWEYMNPFAWLHYLSSVSTPFALLMRSLCVDGRPLRIVLYADGLVPMNPFRPEASRTLMCIYWCIVDWPQWLIQRSFAWPVFSILRESIISKIEGGMSRIMRIVIRIFFNTVGTSFTTGVHINCPSGDFIVTGIMAGVLADLKGHKEVT